MASAAKRQRVDGDAKAAERSEHLEEHVGNEQNDEDSGGVEFDEYFSSYDDLSVHALMLSDEPRVGAYVAAIRALKSSLEGKVVLDVGAGTGLLSLLTAKYGGAARVYAVEAAPTLAKLAETLAARNGLGDVVRVVQGRAEEIQLPEKVDAIISEWMGFYLVHESMLESVLTARDKWMKPGGMMLPSSARIYAALADAENLRKEVESYRNLHGLDMGIVGDFQLQRMCGEPQPENIDPGRLMTAGSLVVDLGDLGTRTPGSTSELSAEVSFVALKSGKVGAVVVWFDVGFGQAPATSLSAGAPEPLVLLSTAPGVPATHWKQTVIYLGAFVDVEAGDVLPIKINLTQSVENPRHYDITVDTGE